MSGKAIDYKIILKRDGQTQQQRTPALLDPAKVAIDERTKADYYKFVQEISKQIKFFDVDASNGKLIDSGTWNSFFETSLQDLNTLASNASIPAHLALWNAFIELMEKPKALMNTVTQRHLDFYYHDVLKLEKKEPIKDKAHVFFELKKNAENILLPAGASLLAGKDTTKQDLNYKMLNDLVVNSSKINQLKSIFISQNNPNVIFYAPIANSKDGLGAELDETNPKWSAFGNASMPVAQIGFCLASSILKMKEGNRKINVSLTLDGLPDIAKNKLLTANLFNISITGEKGWIGPKLISPTITSNNKTNYLLEFSITISKDEPAVLSYDNAQHGGDFDTVNPVIRIFFNNEKTDLGYHEFRNANLINATIEVDVQGIESFGMENDSGTLNPKKPFLPFGPLAEENANFYILSDETFSKRLKSFSLNVDWKNIPDVNLKSYFANYGDSNIDNKYFTASATFKDGYDWNRSLQRVNIFNDANAQSQTKWEFINPGFAVPFPIYKFSQFYKPFTKNTGQSVAQAESVKMSFLFPGFNQVQKKSGVVNPTNLEDFISYKPKLQLILNLYKEIRKGRLQLTLNRSFLFKDYREKYTAEILRYSQNGGELKLPAEPFAPEIQTITLNYKATTVSTNFSGTSINDFIDQEVEFFHYGAFGQAREHGYNRSRHGFLNNSLIKLLPQYEFEGEFFLGLSALNASDSASILFQVVEGSANPEKAKTDLKWAVLCDNYWKALGPNELVFDSTNGLLMSGIVKLVIPKEATTNNTVMPSGLIWIKASIRRDTDGVCNVVDVQTNAAAVIFDDQNNDLNRLEVALPANSINKLKTGNAEIKKITQPFASFGGALGERDLKYYTRLSERLRHKERAISIWDYERIILEHFPNIHKIKCINHADKNSFYSPGSTLIVVVPDLTNQNATDPFEPKVDKNTLDQIKVLLTEHASPWVNFDVVNPTYEAVKITVALKLKGGYEFNYYEKIINLKLQKFLSPWMNQANSEIYFGGKITKSMVIKFLEDLDYVDYLIELSLFQLSGDSITAGRDTEIAEASNPASILVSYPRHLVTTKANVSV